MPDELLVEWWDQGPARQVIGQAELLPILLARGLWFAQLRNRRAIYFIDNDSARDAMIKADSQSPHSRAIIRLFYDLELFKQTWHWFARVSSSGNIADGPARFDFAEISKFPGARRKRAVVPTSLRSLPLHGFWDACTVKGGCAGAASSDAAPASF